MITVGDQVIGGSGGGGGSGLPTASGAGQVPVSAGAGTAYASRGLTAADVSGVGISTGTYAARPGSPSVGDQYLVTSGQRLGSLYRCTAAGIWRPVGLDLGLGDGPSWVFDAESIPPQNTGLLRSWRPVDPGQSLELVAGMTAPAIVASSLGGLPALTFAGSQVLRLAGPPVMKGADKTVIVALSGLQTTGNNGVVAIGDPTSTSASTGLFGNFQASLSTRIYLEHDAGSTGLYDSGTTLSAAAGIHTIAWTWQESGGVARLYADGAPTATASHTTGGGRGVLSTSSQLTFGAGRCNATALGVFTGHGLILAPRRLSDAEIASVHARITGRFAT